MMHRDIIFIELEKFLLKLSFTALPTAGYHKVFQYPSSGTFLRTKPMKTTVHAIQPIEGTKEFIVVISIGIQQEQFTFTVEKANQEEFAVVGGDDRFCKFFRFNQHIAVDVSNLVGIYMGKPVDFPTDVGDFGTPDDAIALQKPFQKSPEKAIQN